MEITPQALRTTIRCILAGSIVLAASACTAPESDPAGARQAANRADQTASARADPAAQAAPDDPVKAVSDALEARLQLMIATAHPAAAH